VEKGDFSIVAFQIGPIEVRVIDNDLEKALRLFKRRLQKEGVMRELRDRKYFLTRTEKRRRKDHKSEIRRIKLQRKSQKRKSYN